MYTRSFHAVMIPITSILMLLGLVSGCIDPTSGELATTNPDENEEVEADAESTVEFDQTTQDQIIQGERFDFWVSIMDSFITENSDWTYSFDQAGFLGFIVTSHPEVLDYYSKSGPETSDTVIIDELVNGLPVASQYALEQYQAFQELPEGAHAAIYGSWHWWGYKRSYTGADSDGMITWMFAGGAYLSIPGIGYVSGPVLTAVASLASWYDWIYGGFSIRIYWSTNISLGAP